MPSRTQFAARRPIARPADPADPAGPAVTAPVAVSAGGNGVRRLLRGRGASGLPAGLVLVLVALATLLGLAGVGGSASAATASTTTEPTEPTRTEPTKAGEKFVNVIEVSGLIDPVMADFLVDAVDAAVHDRAEVLIIQLDSPGAVVSDAALAKVVRRVRHEHRVPIAVWVGPTGARAKGGAVALLRAARVVGVAPGTRIGDAATLPGEARDPLEGITIGAGQALARKIATVDAPVLGEFVTRLDGLTIAGHRIDSAKRIVHDGEPALQPYGVRFAKLAFFPRLLHTVTNPSVAYLLLVIGLSLMVFEYFTGGVGVAAGVGVLSFALAAYGLGNLPMRPIGLLLLALAMFGFAVDVQAGNPRFWTGVGTVALVGGSLLLLGDGQRVPPYWIGIVTVLVLLFMVNGMPTMVRTRFSTPTIGRESMIGELGKATDTIDPEGVVVVKGAPWRARTNRATPIPAGDPVKVVAIDGLLLEVEPLEGAARDAGH